MFKIDNEVELTEFLKILSEEAVNVSKRKLKEKNRNKHDDNLQTAYLDNLRSDEKRLGVKLREEEGDDENKSVEDAEDSPEAEDVEVKKEIEKSEEEKDYGSSFDSVMNAINSIRSGKSFKDSTIKKQAVDYYDKLNEYERTIVQVFFSEFARILTGAVTGAEAQDPSEPPYNFSIHPASDHDKDNSQSAPGKTNTSIDKRQASLPDEEEDTSAPIKVNESQNLTNIRVKLRNLMRD